ncbi:dapper homolog 3-like [Phoenix dactylifera]|uniref:Dapper homolog 3-like n=1 Tax=Phoenix dactylifera TaxID=42345 RepID=A0A8B7BKV9_PHODC|nr:dapper homolog 3-like [Phoenix dactylifera]
MAEAGGTPALGKGGAQRKPSSGIAAKRPSWADVTKGVPRPPVWTCHRTPSRELEELQNRFPEVIEVPEEELEEVRSEWRSTTVLVRSLGRSIPADWVVKEIRRAGKLDYDAECFTLSEGVIAIRFANENDREAAMRNGPWMVAGQVLAMDRWRPSFVPKPGCFGRVVVWLRLPSLPMDFWKKEAIFRVAARAGTPLALDGFTEQRRRYGFARVKVELDASAPLVPGTWVRGSSADGGAPFWQGFVYENLPVPCAKCGRVGHSAVGCVFVPPAEGRLNPEEVSGGSEEVRDGIDASETPKEAETGRERPQEARAFGPWLVTNRIGPTPPAFRKKESPRPDAGKTAGPAASGASPSRPGDGPASPIDLEGWQKPSKVARRRTPEKDVSEAGASRPMGGPSQPGAGSGSDAELTQDSGRVAPCVGRLEERPNASGGLRLGGPTQSPMKRFRSPPRRAVGAGLSTGDSTTSGEGKTPVQVKGRRPAVFFRQRSRSSPPPLAPVGERPPRVDQQSAGGDVRLEPAASTGGRLAHSLSLAADLTELGRTASQTMASGELLTVSTDVVSGTGSGSDGQVTSALKGNSPCQMARVYSEPEASKVKGKIVASDAGELALKSGGGKDLSECVGKGGRLAQLARGRWTVCAIWHRATVSILKF